MHLIFLHGPAASGKLTIARELAAISGYALFHNHLIVDAVGALFAFGTPNFVRLREAFWMESFAAAIAEDRNLIFTFAPEPSVAADFPDRVRALVEAVGGRIDFVALTITRDEQERRIDTASRAEFGKLRSLDLLRALRDQFEACETAMPPSAVTVDTTATPPAENARRIAQSLHLPHAA
ncbi:shikimate kinase [Sphingomonas montanisoli]|uniref:Shikimate kinase n=1 Tax=Sphingomonas montanisoli TaxID=2606412 RepID=A0A5D9C6G2_9SPHN|nr:shikimate kinase [Sphingomonas montanisoli]TZG27269.1 shikimate kinase [Sphingomonas montanisoli]